MFLGIMLTIIVRKIYQKETRCVRLKAQNHPFIYLKTHTYRIHNVKTADVYKTENLIINSRRTFCAIFVRSLRKKGHQQQLQHHHQQQSIADGFLYLF